MSLPVGLRLAGRTVLVAGGGPVAERRVRALLIERARVLLVAPEVTEELARLADQDPHLVWHRRRAAAADLDGVWLLFAHTSSPRAQRELAEAAESRRIFAVIGGDPQASTAWSAAAARAHGVSVGVNAAADPARAKAVAAWIQARLETGEAPVRARREQVLESPDESRLPPGGVALVGGGPGDPGLLTVRGRHLLAEADVVIEAVPENLELKRKVWAQIGAAAPEQAVLCTNSSTLLPSDIAAATGHPERFLALHFANEVWKNNTGEVMGHAGTDPQAVQQVLEFAGQIGLVPIHVEKEQPGYVLNTLLVPFLNAATHLWVQDIAEPEEIDKTWRTATGSPLGPFQILDVVGMETVYQINLNAGTEESKKVAQRIKTEFIDRGRRGRDAGGGFYTY
ncbi:3-hydroxyacyl-CoA dehydrogenase NAD-binding domain-containing protein [Rothia kristinae]|uniref:3-hydroxyacyl-CoA dehydrogenase NAD-binding domain-containing protein n=2 Tax=Rothia kristinae TaxID=37923 RepID=UPI0009C0CF48|nr:3-hydroxyacyl-CoA dehydrogenase NAD-binding domain-containing protein [Rothia kristinae]